MTGEDITEMVENEDLPDSILDAMNSARNWLDGDYEDYPSLVDAWKELVRK
jgi:hypothetical protein